MKELDKQSIEQLERQKKVIYHVVNNSPNSLASWLLLKNNITEINQLIDDKKQQ